MTDENKKIQQAEAPKEEASTESEVNLPQADPVRSITKIVLIAVTFILIWYVIADRYAPWSDQARVQTYVIPVVPQVSGRVIAVDVEKDQIVKAGDPLFHIDPSDYQLAVEEAESSLEIAGQEIGAGVANVVTAQSQLVVAETNFEHIKAQSARIFELEKKKVFSVSEGDKARAAIKQGLAQVRSAQANLEKSKQTLGKEGSHNPRIRSAMAKLKKAQLDLSRTTVLAPSLGGITNLQVDTGFYANAGEPLMTFVEFDNIWLQVNLRENNLTHLNIGDPVEIALDVQPGSIFQGKISSIGFAVNSSTPDVIGGLTSVEATSGWLRDAQRFPVMITFDDINSIPKGSLRVGAQADIQVYTGDNWFVNSMGWLWIRSLSWFSYVY